MISLSCRDSTSREMDFCGSCWLQPARFRSGYPLKAEHIDRAGYLHVVNDKCVKQRTCICPTGDFNYAIEFRHQSWLGEGGKDLDPKVLDILKARNVANVIIDGPGLNFDGKPKPSHAYFRFHGRNYGIWYKAKKDEDHRLDRYDYLYRKELAEGMGFEVLRGIVDCLWVVDSYDWIAFLPTTDGSGAYNRYFGRLSTGKVKIRGVAARKGDTPEYVRRMQEELFECLGEARSREELRRIEPKAQGIYRRYREGLQNADVRELAIHRRVSRLNYSRRCAEASAVQAHLKRGISLAPGMEIGYVVTDAGKWAVDTERDASGFDDLYYRKLLEKAWSEAAFVFRKVIHGSS